LVLFIPRPDVGRWELRPLATPFWRATPLDSARGAAIERGVDERTGGCAPPFSRNFDALGASQRSFAGGRRCGEADSDQGGSGFKILSAEK